MRHRPPWYDLSFESGVKPQYNQPVFLSEDWWVIATGLSSHITVHCLDAVYVGKQLEALEEYYVECWYKDF